MLIYSKIIPFYIQTTIVNSLIFVGISVLFFLISFFCLNNRYYFKFNKYIQKIINIIIGIGISFFGFFYLFNSDNYYFFYFIIIWIFLFQRILTKSSILGLIISLFIFCLVIYFKFENLNGLIINLLFLFISSICFLINIFLTHFKNQFFFIILTYIALYVVFIPLTILLPLKNLVDDVNISEYFFYGFFNLFSLLVSIITYFLIKLIWSFFKKSKTIYTNQIHYNYFLNINKLIEINNFIYSNNINLGYIFKVDLDKNIDYYEYLSLCDFIFNDYKHLNFFYQNNYFHFIKVNNMNQLKNLINKFITINYLYKFKNHYIYNLYGVDDNNLYNLVSCLVNNINQSKNNKFNIISFNKNHLINPYSELNKNNILNKQNMGLNLEFLFNKIKNHLYKCDNLIVNNKIININDFYKQFNNEYFRNIMICYLSTLAIINFKKNNHLNKLLINYPLVLIAKKDFDCNEFILHIKKYSQKIKINFLNADHLSLKDKIIKANLQALKKAKIDYKFENI